MKVRNNLSKGGVFVDKNKLTLVINNKQFYWIGNILSEIGTPGAIRISFDGVEYIDAQGKVRLVPLFSKPKLLEVQNADIYYLEGFFDADLVIFLLKLVIYSDNSYYKHDDGYSDHYNSHYDSKIVNFQNLGNGNSDEMEYLLNILEHKNDS